MNAREIVVGDVPVRALRVTYVGELGWELYCPMEFGPALWRTLWEAGEPHGLRGRRLPRDRLAAPREGLPRVGRRHHARRHALRGQGSASAVKLDKDFIGRDALGDGEPQRRLCCLVLADPRSVALGNEPVRVEGEVCGRVTSGGYGYSVGASIAYAYLPAAHAAARHGEVAVEVFGEWIEGEVRGRAAARSGGGSGPRVRSDPNVDR